MRRLHHAATAGISRPMAAACVHEPARDSLLSTRGQAQRAPARVHEHEARELLVLALRPGATRRREAHLPAPLRALILGHAAAAAAVEVFPGDTVEHCGQILERAQVEGRVEAGHVDG